MEGLSELFDSVYISVGLKCHLITESGILWPKRENANLNLDLGELALNIQADPVFSRSCEFEEA